MPWSSCPQNVLFPSCTFNIQNETVCQMLGSGNALRIWKGPGDRKKRRLCAAFGVPWLCHGEWMGHGPLVGLSCTLRIKGPSSLGSPQVSCLCCPILVQQREELILCLTSMEMGEGKDWFSKQPYGPSTRGHYSLVCKSHFYCFWHTQRSSQLRALV